MVRKNFLMSQWWGAVFLCVSLAAVGCAEDTSSGADACEGLIKQMYNQELGDLSFNHGVASGEPSQEGFLIWTRVTPGLDEVGDIPVTWRVATDPEMKNIVQQGDLIAYRSHDFSVKAMVDGLDAGQTYYYRFYVSGQYSVIGRAKSLPTGDIDALRLAVVSCSKYASGFFHVYRLIANQAATANDFDFVVHLGDYLYEYGPSGFGDANLEGRNVYPAKEILTLTDYRSRHANLKEDTYLQALHQNYTTIIVWDDHEVANDAYLHGADNHDPDTEGDWAERKAAALQAYFEWMPVSDNAGNTIYRNFEFGQLASLTMLDTRHQGRQKQLVYSDMLDETDNFLAAWSAFDRTILGSKQENWVKESLENSTARWKLVGSQVMMAPLFRPSLPFQLSHPLLAENELVLEKAEILRGEDKLQVMGMPLTLDSWDGYLAARQKMYDLFAAVGNVVVLAGDMHTAFASDLVPDDVLLAGYEKRDGEGAVAVEFVTPSVTTPGLDYLLPPEYIQFAGALLEMPNPHIHYNNVENRGYMVIDVNKEAVQATWHFTAVDQLCSSEEWTEGPYAVLDGTSHVVEVNP